MGVGIVVHQPVIAIGEDPGSGPWTQHTGPLEGIESKVPVALALRVETIFVGRVEGPLGLSQNG